MNPHCRREQQQQQSLGSAIKGQPWQLTQFTLKAKASEFLCADTALPETAAHGSLPVVSFCPSRAGDVSPYLYIQAVHKTHREKDQRAKAAKGKEATFQAQIVFRC